MEAIPDAVNTEALLAHADWVRALARTLVADPNRADDVAQEAWVNALESPPRDARNVRGWFASVVRNAASQSRRSETRRTVREKSVAREEALPETAELVARASLQRDLVGHVLALEEPYRRTILLRFFQGLEVREIAEQEGVELSTVRTRLQRGIAKLRESLDRAWGERSSWCAAVAALARTPGTREAIATSSALGIWILGVAGCVVAAAGVWWVWGSDSGASTSVVIGSIEDRLAGPGETLPEFRGVLTQPEDVSRSIMTPAGTTESIANASTAELPRTKVRGRVVDIRGNPVAGLRVRARDPKLPRRNRDMNNVIHWWVGNTSFTDAVEPGLDSPESAQALERFLSERGNPAGLREAILGIDLSTQALTSGDGSFEFTAAGTEPRVECADEAWVFACDGWMELRTLHVFVAAPVIDLGGNVVDAEAMPISNVHVEFGVTWNGLSDFPLSFEASNPGSWLAITDLDGRFRLSRVPRIPGGEVRASKESWRMSALPQPNESKEDLTIVLTLEQPQVRPHVRGSVLDVFGKPVARALVQFGQDESVSDETGRFDIEMTMGPVEGFPLTAISLGRQGAVIERFSEQLAGKPDGIEDVVLRVGPEARSIRGRILDAEGRPSSGWKVELEDGTPSGTMSVSLEGATLDRGLDSDIPNTDETGQFEVGGLRDRSYRLRAWQDSTCLVLLSEPIQAGSEGVELRVPPDAFRAVVRGIVLSKRGRPVPGADVGVTHVRERSGVLTMLSRCRTVHTDALGHFEIQDLPRRHVQIWVEGDSVSSDHVEIPPDAIRDEVRIEVELQCRFRVEPRLRDPVDRCEILDAEGQVLRVTEHNPRSTSVAYASIRGEHGFPVCTVSDEAASLVLYQGKQELRRVPLDLHPGELQVVVP